MGFFDKKPLESMKKTESLVAKCGACGLYKSCRAPKMPVSGEGRKGILILSDFITNEEEQDGRRFTDSNGRYLRDVLGKYDIDLELDCWHYSSIICSKFGNPYPTADEVDYCRPNVMETIKTLNPRVIVPIGYSACKSLFQPLYREDIGKLDQWLGWKIPLQKWNCWICPTYTPSSCIDPGRDARRIRKDYHEVNKVWFERHIESISNLSGRPWEVVPDWDSQIEVILDPDEAARRLRRIVEDGTGSVAFDYETTCLKPDNDGEIVSCAVCWNGVEMIAYPWMGMAIHATKWLLTSPIRKIGYNCAFESRWTMAKLGVEVNNFDHDGMLSTHHLDNRENICSAKFQGFVRLGLEPYDEEVKPYLIGEGGYGKNRIRDADIKKLLTYNGMDAIVEYFCAAQQEKELEECLSTTGHQERD